MSTEKNTAEPEFIENELSTGLVIAGAYADKLRRTLFAQLRDYVKKNKELAREIARAAGEVNRILYIILVENLRSDKGDVVRIRIKYRFNIREQRITWDYDTLRIEYFKRYPDEEVNKTARKVLEERLEEVKEQYRETPPKEEAREEWSSGESTKPLEKPIESTQEIINNIGSIDPIGDTSSGGTVFKIVDKNGENIGIASLEPRAGEWIVDAILIIGGKSYRIYGKVSGDKNTYVEQPVKLLNELSKYEAKEIDQDTARELIEGKMGDII